MRKYKLYGFTRRNKKDENLSFCDDSQLSALRN